MGGDGPRNILAADAEAAPEGELYDAELETVAGGAKCGCILIGMLKGCGCVFTGAAEGDSGPSFCMGFGLTA